jgi:hypothetical protein
MRPHEDLGKRTLSWYHQILDDVSDRMTVDLEQVMDGVDVMDLLLVLTLCIV